MFVATQVPLPNTVGDFWAMVFDYKCNTVVALNDPLKTDKTCGQYLPNKGIITCGLFTIELLNTDTSDNTTERKVRLTKTYSKTDVFDVTIIQYTDWHADSDLPDSPASFVTLMNRAEWSHQNKKDERMAVMCMNGVDRCGLFSALISITNQINETQRVDVFRAVKRLKKTRHNMVNSIDQYRFCYQTARVYLESYATYANLM
ncbi:receptor-type tyrosine-protein phosphatase T-like [Amphiura filiformis]|uniref:receptor-type tyrosine-protein phosphatase T-like n=1 Tax=Amphiura filiformis TaxID=82378 RepID=UPI003B20EBBF